MSARNRSFGYLCLYGLLKILALLPFSILYILSDVTFFLLYHVVRYRRRVVDDNLKSCFPDKSDRERAQIRRRFYRNFSDYIFETVKLLSVSDSQIAGRMTFAGLEVIDNLVAQGRSVVVYFSHCGNWEWAPSITLHTRRKPGEGVEYCQVYRPLSSKNFDSIMLRIRSRFNSLSFPKKSVLRDLIMLRRQGKESVTGFMSDQKPSHGDPTVPLMFLNRPTAFISGTETLARKLGMAAVYWDMEKPSRGHYHITCRLLAENVADTPAWKVTHDYARMLEKTITRNPSIWLWTHKRWKNPVTLPVENL